MRRLAIVGTAFLLAACGGAGASLDPSAAPSGSAGGASPSAPATDAPSPSAGVVPGVVFRAWTTQALPPAATFAWSSSMVIADGRVIMPGAQILIYPGPLLPTLTERTITPAGVSRVFEAAQAHGLLAGPADLTGGIAPGGMTAHLLFVIDGQDREVVGDPNKMMMCIQAPCTPPPGTPEAFGAYWAQVSDVNGLAGGELGAEREYVPERIAILITDPPPGEEGLEPGLAQWPLAMPLREFGVAFGGGTDRCGVIEGPDVARFLPVAQQANALSQWTDGTTGGRALVVRPVLPGEPDPCA